MLLVNPLREKYGCDPRVYRGVEFYLTCYACPEQYDAYYEGNMVGYIRLRWGRLTATYPDVGGKLVYEANIGDDGWQGCFTDNEEECLHLVQIAEALKKEVLLMSP
jgi:hypothetical protein